MVRANRTHACAGPAHDRRPMYDHERILWSGAALQPGISAGSKSNLRLHCYAGTGSLAMRGWLQLWQSWL